MTIDLTDGADAGWLSFTAEDAGTTDDGRQRVRINRGRSRHTYIAVEEGDGDETATIEELDRTDTVSDGWLEEAEKWFRTQVLDEPDIYKPYIPVPTAYCPRT